MNSGASSRALRYTAANSSTNTPSRQITAEVDFLEQFMEAKVKMAQNAASITTDPAMAQRSRGAGLVNQPSRGAPTARQDSI